MDDADPDSITIGEYNRGVWPQFCEQFRLRGVMAGSWTTAGGELYLTPGDADFAIAEIEGPGDYEGVANLIDGKGAGPLPRCSLATVTNFSTMTRTMARKLIDAGFSCLPEAYMNENPNQTPTNMDAVARNLGWPTSQPVVGVYPNPTTGAPPPSYAQWADWPLADYLGEYVV